MICILLWLSIYAICGALHLFAILALAGDNTIDDSMCFLVIAFWPAILPALAFRLLVDVTKLLASKVRRLFP